MAKNVQAKSGMFFKSTKKAKFPTNFTSKLETLQTANVDSDHIFIWLASDFQKEDYVLVLTFGDIKVENLDSERRKFFHTHRIRPSAILESPHVRVGQVEGVGVYNSRGFDKSLKNRSRYKRVYHIRFADGTLERSVEQTRLLKFGKNVEPSDGYTTISVPSINVPYKLCSHLISCLRPNAGGSSLSKEDEIESLVSKITINLAFIGPNLDSLGKVLLSELRTEYVSAERKLHSISIVSNHVEKMPPK